MTETSLQLPTRPIRVLKKVVCPYAGRFFFRRVGVSRLLRNAPAVVLVR